jgi:hypothetical protein
MSSIGAILEEQDNLEGAREMHTKASVGYEKGFGPDGPHTQQLRNIEASPKMKEQHQELVTLVILMNKQQPDFHF